MLFTAVLSIAACASQATVDAPPPTTESSAGYRLSPEIHFVDRWVPTEKLDLNSADGTFVRAFVEATIVAFYSGGAEHSYPGFMSAMQPAIAQTRYQRTARETYGVTYSRITSFTELPNNQAQATGCSTSPIGWPRTPTPIPDKTQAGPIYAFALTYQRIGDAPPSEQHGDQRAPSVSVFGDWHALHFDPLFSDVDATATKSCHGQQSGDHYTPSPGWPPSHPHV